MAEYKFGFQPFIFVDTNFRRKNEPVFALAAMESSRRIRIPKEISALSLDQQIPHVTAIIRNHFNDCDGELPLWGAVFCYKYFYDEHSSLIFSTKGAVTAMEDGSDVPCARVTIEGKSLFNSI